jgi:hypothetical protein
VARTKGRARMPGLNLLTEYKLNFPGILLFDDREDVIVDGVE